MPITRMNHAVLYVRDARRTQALLRRRARLHHRHPTTPSGAFAFMRAPASDEPPRHRLLLDRRRRRPQRRRARTVGLYHVAWEVPTLDELEEIRDRLAAAGALVGASDHGANKSLYAHDPDGLEFEVMWARPGRALGRRGAPGDRRAARPRRRAASASPSTACGRADHREHGHVRAGRRGGRLGRDPRPAARGDPHRRADPRRPAAVRAGAVRGVRRRPDVGARGDPGPDDRRVPRAPRQPPGRRRAAARRSTSTGDDRKTLVRQLFEVRQVIEPAMAALACRAGQRRRAGRARRASPPA